MVGFVGGCLRAIVEGDGGEGEGGFQIFVFGVVGDLGVGGICGREFKGEVGNAMSGPTYDDVDGRLILHGRLTGYSPIILVLLVLAHHTYEADQQ